MGHRYYDPSQARFLSRDPIGYEGGINLYAYCGNNPIGFADPDGTGSITLHTAGSFAGHIAGNAAQHVAQEEIATRSLQVVGTAFGTSASKTIAARGAALVVGARAAGVVGLYITAAQVGYAIGHPIGNYLGGQIAATTSTGTTVSMATSTMVSNGLARWYANLANKIGNGHAFDRHFLGKKPGTVYKGGWEFGDLGIRTRQQFINHIARVIQGGQGIIKKSLRNGRIGFYDTTTNTLVFYDPSKADLGTAYRPANGIQEYNDAR